MKSILYALPILLAASNARAEEAEETPKALQAVADFFIKHVDGRTLESEPRTLEVEPGKLISERIDGRHYSNVKVEGNYFSFVMQTDNTVMNFKLDENGQKILPGTDESKKSSATYLYRFYATEAAPEVVLGLATRINEENYVPALSLRIAAYGDKVVLHQRNALEFSDGFSAQGPKGRKPIISTSENIFSLDDKGKLVFDTVNDGYDYDIATRKAAEKPYSSLKGQLREVAVTAQQR
jgi:hypothetical protein